MRKPTLLLLGLLLPLFAPAPAVAQSITLSQLLIDIAKHPKAVQQVLSRLGDSVTATGMLSPEQLKMVTIAIAKKDWQRLEYFPTSTLDGLEKTIAKVGKKAGSKKADFCADTLAPKKD